MSETDQGLRLLATPEVGGELCPVLSVDVVHGPAPHYPAAVVTVAGELDTVGAEILDSAWAAGRAALPPSVVLDLQQVSFCNAAGLRVLARIADSCRAGGIRLQSSSGPRLEWLLDLVGVRLDAPDGDEKTCMSAPTGWPD